MIAEPTFNGEFIALPHEMTYMSNQRNNHDQTGLDLLTGVPARKRTWAASIVVLDRSVTNIHDTSDTTAFCEPAGGTQGQDDLFSMTAIPSRWFSDAFQLAEGFRRPEDWPVPGLRSRGRTREDQGTRTRLTSPGFGLCFDSWSCNVFDQNGKRVLTRV